MSEAEWRDGDDPKVRALFGYALRSHVNYQDGRHSEAPALVFADYDYEVGDGACGLHADGKSANEPAIVYVRADALIDALARAERAEAEAGRLREAFRAEREENLWNAFNIGSIRSDGKWIDCGLSDAEWLVRELGLDQDANGYDPQEIKRRISEAAARAALEGDDS